jgi:hypothetical protein
MRISYGSGHRRRDLGPLGLALVAAVTVLLVGAIAYGMASEPGRARRLLAESGYTDIGIEPRRVYYRACGRARGVAPGFVATGPDGRRAKGIVCTAPLFPDIVVQDVG